MRKTEKFGGGQRIVSPYKTLSDGSIRKLLIDSLKNGKEIHLTIDSLGLKNARRAFELLHSCPTLEQALIAA